MQKIQKLTALMLAVLMVVMVLPITAITAFASVNPVAKATLFIADIYEDYKTGASPDKGWHSSPRGFYFEPITPLNSVGEQIVKDYGPKYQAYCIDHGGIFRGQQLDQYVGYTPKDSTYFTSLSKEQQKGILLAAVFGYPRSEGWEYLVCEGAVQEGDCLEDAVAATQAILWEFNLNSRTGFGINDRTDDWAYMMVKGDDGAERAYARILASAQQWLDEGHNWESLLSNEGIVVWENGDTAQVMITAKVEIVDPFGSISIKKVDEATGEGLAGAVFTIYSENGDLFEVLEETSAENGYTARTGDANDPDTVPYGKYRIIETKVPDGYTAVQKSWTVVVDEDHKHVELIATNRPILKVQILKTGDADLIENKQFAIYDNATNKRLATLTTGADGLTEIVELPYAETYRWEELGVGTYKAEAKVGGKWVGVGTPWTFKAEDIAVNKELVLEARNTKLPGQVTVKKVTYKDDGSIDNSAVSNFHFQILDPSDRAVLAEGYTNADGYLITGSRVGVHNLLSAPYTLNNLCFNSEVFFDWGEYNDIACSYMYSANIKMTTEEFLGEIKKYNNDTNGEYVIADWDYDGPILVTSTTAMFWGIDIPVLLRKNGSSYEPLGYISKTGPSGSSAGSQDMNVAAMIAEALIEAWTSRSGITTDYVDIKQYVKYFTTEGNELTCTLSNGISRRLYASDVKYDANYDGKIDKEDVALYQAAADAGRMFIENPLITLEEGQYILKEIMTDVQSIRYAAPEEKTILVKANETTAVEFYNYAKSSSIRIIKESEDGIIAGFEFTVTGPNGFSYTGKTGDDGTIFISQDDNGEKVLAGTYTISEINVPSKYNKPLSQTITITDADTLAHGTKSVTFVNKLKAVNFTILKSYAEDGVLDGHKFNLYGYNIKGEYIDIICTTDANGRYVTSLYPGYYYISEIPSEDGRYVTPEIKEVNLYIDESTGVVFNNGVSFENVLKKFTVELYKEGSGLQSNNGLGESTLIGAVYGLYKDGVEEERQTTRNVNGRAYLKFGTYICDAEASYTVREITAPNGYYLDPTVYSVDSSPKSHDTEINTITINSVDARIYGKITVYKLKGTEENNVPEAGAVFNVYLKSAGSYANADENHRDTITTDREKDETEDPMGYFGGIATTKELPYGTYIVQQVSGDDRFELAAPFEVVIDAEHTSETYTVLNKTTVKPVTITKQDITGTKNLPGAQLKLVDENGTEYTGTTDENGQYTFTVWPGMSYTLTELVAPEGYVLASESVTFTLDIYGEVIEGSTIIKNEANRVVVKKVDTEGNALEGATFECTNVITGSVFGTAITDENGIAVFECLPYGDYEIRETQCIAGYKLSEEVFEFTISTDWTNQPEGEYDFECVNEDTELVIEKIDAESKVGLAGAFIEIYDAEGNVYASGETDSEGKFTFKNIVPGEYTFKETKAPNSYELNPTVFNFTVSENGDIVGQTVITDKPNRYVVKKVDAEGNALAGTIFQMTDDETGEVFATVESDENGLVVFESIPFGKYTIKEVTPTPGYVLSKEKIEIEVTDEWINLGEGEFNSKITNEPTVVIFEKKDADTNEGIAGAEITIYDANGEIYAIGVTDENGQFIVSNIVPGSYLFAETKAPDTYELNNYTSTLIITENGNVIGSTIIKDRPNRYIVKKVDTEGNVLAGAVFQMINDETGEVFATVTSDENGLAIFERIPFGKYTIKEITPAPGYVISGAVIQVEITPEWTNVEEGEFNSEYLNASTIITFEKKDASTGEYVAGAEITIYDKDGNVYVSGTTDETGRYTVYNIVPGEYTWKETYAPEGYVLNETVFSFIITENGEVIGDNIITNVPVEVIISKTDITNGEAVPNAEVLVTDELGNEVFKGMTDENGNITLKYLKPGKYTFKEIKAPTGYKLNKTVYEFEVNVTGTVIGTLEFTNEPTEVTISKTNEDGTKLLEGATVVIIDANGKEVFKGVTDANGEVKAFYLAPGKYTFKEVAAPEGYALNIATFDFTIDEDGNVTGDDTITDEPMLFRVYKVNELGQPMKDVEFAIYDENGDEVKTVKTDEEGYAEFIGLEHGKYTIREIKTWDGYVLANDSIKIEVDGTWLNDAEGSVIEVENHPIPQTGDATNLLMWGILAMSCAFLLAVMFKKMNFTRAF